ncbi:hypothetical protein HPG69_002096, partial [Diceros bicornis minor]
EKTTLVQLKLAEAVTTTSTVGFNVKIVEEKNISITVWVAELLMRIAEVEFRDTVLLVFANKQDLPNAMNVAEITDKLGLHYLCHRNWFLQAS